jgi:hypothetical protein
MRIEFFHLGCLATFENEFGFVKEMEGVVLYQQTLQAAVQLGS